MLNKQSTIVMLEAEGGNNTQMQLLTLLQGKVALRLQATIDNNNFVG